MKKLFVVAFLVIFGFIVMNRQRVYVRDPIASVYRNDVKQSGVQVFINYSNDVLLWRDSDQGGYRLLVQNWNKMPGTPQVLRCIRWMACLADSEHAVTFPIESMGKGAYDPQVTMTNREVRFVNGDGAAMKVQLR